MAADLGKCARPMTRIRFVACEDVMSEVVSGAVDIFVFFDLAAVEPSTAAERFGIAVAN